MLLALPLNTISSVYLLTSLVLIEKELHAFLWGHLVTHQGLHRITWNKICISRKIEGLGITSLFDKRNQCHCKISSHLLFDTNLL